MVQDRATDFQRSGHAHTIHFREHIRRQVGLGVEVKQAAETIRSRCFIEISAVRLQRVRTVAGHAKKLLRKQAAFAVARGKKRDAVEIAIAPWQGEVESEPSPASRGVHSRIKIFAEVLPDPSGNEFISLPC